LTDHHSTPASENSLHNYLALDYGRRRVGVAAAEAGISIAFGVTTLLIHNLKDLLSQLEPILQQRQPQTIILGFPLGLEERPGPVAGDILSLRRDLQKAGWAVMLVDEALSSHTAASLLRNRGKRSPKEAVDRSAAAVLLQDYLDGRLSPLPEIEIQQLTRHISGSPR
jgi:putative Holliday junction resolvase